MSADTIPTALETGDIRRVSEWRGYHTNGATTLGRHDGFVIAKNMTGQGSIDLRIIPYFSLADHPGLVVATQIDYEHTEGALKETDFNLTASESNADGLLDDMPDTLEKISVEQISDTRIRMTVVDTIEEGDHNIVMVPFIGENSKPQTQDAVFRLVGMTHHILSVPDGTSVNQIIADFRADMLAERRRRGDSGKVATVSSDGNGDYDNIVEAFRNIRGGSRPGVPNTLILSGLFSDEVDQSTEINLADNMAMGARGHPHEVRLEAIFPPGTEEQENIEPLFNRNSVDQFGFSVISEQARYPDHEESGNISVGRSQSYEYMFYSNRGADGWVSWSAIGAGDHTGKTVTRRLNFLEQPYGYHTHINWEKGTRRNIDVMYIDVLDQVGFSRVDDKKKPVGQFGALVAKGHGSGVVSHVEISGLVTNSILVNIAADPLPGAKVTTQKGYPYEYVHVIKDSHPIATAGQTTSSVLELRALEGDDSKVAVSGDGALALFGTVPNQWEGGVGFAARLFSEHSVKTAGHDPGVSLSKRLGNLSETELTMEVQLNGRSYDLSLDKDFSDLTNAAIIDILNTKLSEAMGKGSALGRQGFFISEPYIDRNPDFIPVAESLATNLESFVIKRKAGLVFADNADRGLGVRLMKKNDPAYLFAGISLGHQHPAMGNSVPGRSVRIRSKGDVLGRTIDFDGDINDVAFGKPIGIGDTPGQFVSNPETPLLYRVADSAFGPVFRIIHKD